MNKHLVYDWVQTEMKRSKFASVRRLARASAGFIISILLLVLFKDRGGLYILFPLIFTAVFTLFIVWEVVFYFKVVRKWGV